MLSLFLNSFYKAAGSLLAVFLLSPPLFAAPRAPLSAAAAWAKLEAELSSPECRTRLKEIAEMKLLLALPAAQDFATVPGIPGFSSARSLALRRALVGWSSDLLIKLVIDLDQHVSSLCPNVPRLAALRTTLQQSYLDRLGLKATSANVAEISFRAFMALKSDLPALHRKLTGVASLPIERKPGALYGGADSVDGVVVLGANVAQVKRIRELLRTVCAGSPTPCRFWDRRWLYKVVVVPDEAVAAYLPELGVLVLSRILIQSETTLAKIVMVHELAHALLRRAEIGEGAAWSQDFAKLSGWTRAAEGKWTLPPPKPIGQRTDALSKESINSAFSFLPDPVYGPVGTADGFVFARTYRETLEQNDPAEDFADHVAAFLFAPERFCFGGKPIAPEKFRWISVNVFHRSTPLTCAP